MSDTHQKRGSMQEEVNETFDNSHTHETNHKHDGRAGNQEIPLPLDADLMVALNPETLFRYVERFQKEID